MVFEQLLSVSRDLISGRQVFSEPYERDGVTVITAANVRGGGGGGNGPEGDEGNGGGFGVMARPAGAYVIRDGEVSWEPAIDVNRMALAAVAVVFLVTRWRIKSVRARRS